MDVKIIFVIIFDDGIDFAFDQKLGGGDEIKKHKPDDGEHGDSDGGEDDIFGVNGRAIGKTFAGGGGGRNDLGARKVDRLTGNTAKIGNRV